MTRIAASSVCVLSILGVLAVPVLADGARRQASAVARKDTAKKPNLGESFGLKQRRSSRPTADTVETVGETRSLPRALIDGVIKDRITDLEYCWLKLAPSSRRIATSTMLHLTIEPIGTVSEAHVGGDLPAGVGKCIVAAAGKWLFPVADKSSEIDHPITLAIVR